MLKPVRVLIVDSSIGVLVLSKMGLNLNVVSLKSTYSNFLGTGMVCFVYVRV